MVIIQINKETVMYLINSRLKDYKVIDLKFN